MDFSDWFDFNNRVKQDMTLVKEVNGRTVTKQVKGSFNWLAWLFNWLYPLCTQKYRTQGFIKKSLIPLVVAYVGAIVVMIIFGQVVSAIIEIAITIWYGFMFDTWFKNQLIANGYHVDNSVHTESNTEQHDFE